MTRPDLTIILIVLTPVLKNVVLGLLTIFFNKAKTLGVVEMSQRLLNAGSVQYETVPHMSGLSTYDVSRTLLCQRHIEMIVRRISEHQSVCSLGIIPQI